MQGFRIQNRKLIVHFEVAAAHLLVAFLVLGLILYFAWEVHWYQRRGLYFIKWHTHIMFATLVGVAIVTPFLLWNFKAKTEKSKKFLLAACSTALMVILVEAFFTATGGNKVYAEIRNGFYQSPYAYDSLNYYHIRRPHENTYLKTPEYSYLRKYNSMGYSDVEWTREKAEGTKRVLTLGDSFTEGDGAPADSSYPALLQQLLKGRGKYEVLNAGLCGSDPVLSYMNIKDRLLQFSPDIVVITISDNDIYFDMAFRGGLERFVSDSVVRHKQPPKWEFFYAISYFARPFFHLFGYDISNPVSPSEMEQYQKEVSATLKQLVLSVNDLAVKNNFKALFVKLPLVTAKDEPPYIFNFSALDKLIDSLPNTAVTDLYPCYLDYAEAKNKNLRDFFWKIDSHHNGKGYLMMAECIAEPVVSITQNSE